MLQCSDTITVIRCDGERYTTTVIRGVSWYDKTQIKQESTGMAYANVVKIRIPEDVLPDALPNVGDLVIRGTMAANPISPVDIAPYKPRKIMAVSDNLRGGLPHVAVMAE